MSLPCSFDQADARLSAIAVGRGIEVTCNDFCAILFGDFPELAQQALGNFPPLRCRLFRYAEGNGDGLLNLVLTRRCFRPQAS